MTAITVFGKPNCVQCKQTMKALEKAGLVEGEDVTYRDVTEDPRAYAYVTEELGYSAAPVIVLDDQDHWSGFNPTHNRRAVAWAMAQRGKQPTPPDTLDVSPGQTIGEGLRQDRPVEARAPAATAPARPIDLHSRLAQLRHSAHTTTSHAAGLPQAASTTTSAPVTHPSAALPAPGRQLRA
ncbi:glutaredoxin family protein [Miniimonas sp. S16]|uniref:glutaredoxin family protein n=1 Tax=Miniimonas sp. S16 TaxID=2171623 RepID=UPI00351A3883